MKIDWHCRSGWTTILGDFLNLATCDGSMPVEVISPASRAAIRA
ncbi:MAG: hypothetical protein HW384_2099, partial [Dehalococcoidia bacterium]|nr:hypothetical protein [Dehalococcoidia bacterium]